MKKNQSWIDQRFPLSKVWNEHLAEYYTPRNFNFWYFFGGLAVLMLGMQLITGIFLTMYYKPDAANAFASVEYIMRDIEWAVSYTHLRAHETVLDLVCRLLLEKKKKKTTISIYTNKYGRNNKTCN